MNGAGKSTLLGLVSGEVHPTSGKVKRGKTIKIAFLTQQLAELEDIWEDRVSDVLKRQKSTYVSRRQGDDADPAARAGRVLERADVDPGQGAVGRAEASPAAAADHPRRAERADPG